MRTFSFASIVWVACAAGIIAAPRGPDPIKVQSPEVVRQVVAAMTGAGLTAIAAPEPGAPDHYVAAMLFPGVQLLVIRARTTAPAYIEAELAAGRYDSVYRALQQGEPASKLFVQDMGGDGIHGTSDAIADIVYRRGVDQHVLDGDHKAAKLSAKDYAALVQDLDGQYAKLLALLVEPANARLAATSARAGR